MDVAKTIFISHAAPADDQFTLWLALRLMAIGYDVWCDLLKLSKGGDFWSEIEAQLRTKTCKFLLVQSRASNSADGVLKEIAVAQKVKKVRKDANFILPLKIDAELSYDDINVDVIRLNSIDFTESWAKGFMDLQKALIDQKCPKAGNDSSLSTIVDRLANAKQAPVSKDEIYDSNWFSIINPPEYLNFFPIGNANAEMLDFPVLTYKRHIVTFWELDGLPQALKEQISLGANGHRLKLADYMTDDNKTDFIWPSTYRRLYVGVLSKVFDYNMLRVAGIKSYSKSNHVSFWYPKGAIEKDRVGRIHLVGKHKQHHWHFAISGSVKLFPAPLLQIRSHVLFSADGNNLESSDAVQHRARRAIGKCWWNKEWRTRLLAFVKSLESEVGCDSFALKEGLDTAVQISCAPIQFISNISYAEPGREAEIELDERANEDVPVFDVEGQEVVDL